MAGDTMMEHWCQDTHARLFCWKSWAQGHSNFEYAVVKVVAPAEKNHLPHKRIVIDQFDVNVACSMVTEILNNLLKLTTQIEGDAQILLNCLFSLPSPTLNFGVQLLFDPDQTPT